LLKSLLLKTVIAGSQEAQQKLMLAFDAMYQRYFDHITWEPVGEYETRVAALLPCLILARVDGKSPADIYRIRTHNVRRISCTLLERQFRQLKDITSFWRKENGL
jgi:hypothetical protein